MSQLRAIVDKLLTGVSSAYVPKGFICEQVLPTVQSKQYSGLLGKYGTNHLRIENSVKGGRGKYRQVETRVYSTTSYLIEGHGLEGFVSKEDYANVEEPFDAERDEVMGISTMLWLEKEKTLADTLNSTSIMTQNVTLSGTSQFSDYANSDVLGVTTTAQNTILNATGVLPNLAIMDIAVWKVLRYHPQLLDALGFKWNRPGGMSQEEMAKALGVDQVLFGSARYESAKEGQTSSLASVWGKNISFLVSPDKAEIMQKSVGYLVRPTGGQPRKVYKETNFNPPGSTKVLVEDEYDMLISDVNCGYLIASCIA
jgi:hypothetical protein